MDDTIAAIASPPGGAAQGIVRVAGPGTVEILARTFRAADARTLAEVRFPSRLCGQIELGDLGGRRLPCELYLWPTERSYCRMPMAEIHTIGSPPLLGAVLRAVCAGGTRVAAPGEFTLRAFLGGRIDLPQAEAVLGVIDAAGKRELQTALTQLAGGLSRPLAELRDSLLETLAHLEAGLDFVEEDIQFISPVELDAALESALKQIESLAARMESRTDTTDAVNVVLTGLSNAGKSSLFNALVNRYGTAAAPALVSDQPGTTRDYLTARLVLDGLECILIDTAGQSADIAADSPDAAAQRAAHDQITRADVEVHCVDVQTPGAMGGLPALERGLSIITRTKCDLPRQHASFEPPTATPLLETSAATGAGLANLAAAIRAAVFDARESDTSVVAATAQRCRASMASATTSLHEARRLVTSPGTEELLAAEIRAALTELGHVSGAVYTDDILDRVFSRFCIGK